MLANSKSIDPAAAAVLHMVAHSEQLSDALSDALEADGPYALFDEDERTVSSLLAAELSLEHGSALRALMITNHCRAATALLRMQYEALVRSSWLLYAASPEEVQTMQQDLSFESEKAANNLPFFGLMLKALEGKGPPPLYASLVEVKVVMGKALNSYVHSGIHALQRGQHGYPLPLALQVIQSSNGLSTMAAMMLGNLTGDPRRARRINALVPKFKDCLPPLLPIAAR